MALLTLAEAKAQLDITTTTHDTELQAYVDAIDEVIEGIIGPVTVREFTEQVDGRGPTLSLLRAPAISLTSFTPVLDGGPTLDVAQLHLNGALGEVRRKDGACFIGGPWMAVYQAGRAPVSPTINISGRILLQHWWRTQYGAARGNVGGADDFDVNEPVAGWGYAIPNRVLQLLEPFKTGPGVA
ncbi:head-tail connector protein [Streptomyces gardneri]|uniref:head-tail connector protein n=1 Tax=Streptomyces gardneri TaxID=66892 RepID=UPI0033E07FD8